MLCADQDAFLAVGYNVTTIQWIAGNTTVSALTDGVLHSFDFICSSSSVQKRALRIC
jgi:hypothetical protein